MKQAKIRLNVIVAIEDKVKHPDGHITAPIRIHRDFKDTIRELIWDKAIAKDMKAFSSLLEEYVKFSILDMVKVPYTPLTTEEALKLKDCEIEEVGDGKNDD